MAAKVTAQLALDKSGFMMGVRESKTALAGIGTAAVAAGNLISGSITSAIGAARASFSTVVADSLKLNSNLQVATGTFEVFTKSAKTAKEIVSSLRNEADRTPFDTAEMIDAGKALISSAKGSNAELMKLIKTAEVLAALQPEQGLKGAAFSIKEALGGDYQSLIERFNIGRTQVNKLKDQGLSGIALVNKALKQMGAGPELVTKLADTFEGRKSTVISFADELKRIAGEPVFDKLSTSFQGLIDYMDNGGGKAKFTAIATDIGKELGGAVDSFVATIKGVDWKAEFQGLKDAAIEAVATMKAAKDVLNDAPGTAKTVGGVAGGIWALGKARLEEWTSDDGTVAGSARSKAAHDKAEQIKQSMSAEHLLAQNFPGRGAGPTGDGAISPAEVQQNTIEAKVAALKANQEAAAAAYKAPSATAQAQADWTAKRNAAMYSTGLQISINQRDNTHQIMSS